MYIRDNKGRFDSLRMIIKKALALVIIASAITAGIAVAINQYAKDYAKKHPVIDTQVVEKIIEAERPFPAVMARILKAESNNKHLRDGQVLIVPILTGKYKGTYDIGIAQINSMHNKDATKRGYDLMKEKDNIAYALFMYDTQGTAPWSASEHRDDKSGWND